jgi:hypothetical protein
MIGRDEDRLDVRKVSSEAKRRARALMCILTVAAAGITIQVDRDGGKGLVGGAPPSQAKLVITVVRAMYQGGSNKSLNIKRAFDKAIPCQQKMLKHSNLWKARYK